MSTFLGSNIKYLRKKLGENQLKVASVLNKGATTIGNWEKEISEPNLNELQALSQYFGVSVDDLLSKDIAKGNLIVSEEGGHYDQNSNLKGNQKGNLNTKKDPSNHDRGSPKTDLPIDVQVLQTIIESKNEMISAKDELLRSKDEIIKAQKVTIDGLMRELEAAGATIKSAKNVA